MNIDFRKEKDEKGKYYCATIEKDNKEFVEMYLSIDNDNRTTIDYISFKSVKDFNVLKEAMERLYSYSLKDNNVFDNFYIGDVIFGIDDRNNIILGEIVSFEDTVYKSFNVKVRIMNDTYNIEHQKNLNYSQIINLNLDNFVHIEDKVGLNHIREKRKEYQLQKIYFNRIDDHINKTTINIEFLNKKLKNINKYIELLESKEQSEKIKRCLNDLTKAKKNIEVKKKNSILKVTKEKRLRESLIEDKVFNDIFDYVVSLNN